MIPFPDKKYQIIYADPPWQYRDRRISITSDKPERYGGITYNTMPIKEICALRVKDISDTHCTLFIWVTMPLLEVCFEIINTWGFKYATCGFTWVKINKKASGKMFFTENDIRSGLGSYTNSNVELCLIGRKGSCLERKRKDIKQIIFEPVLRHSQKPKEARKRIIDLYGNLSRIELFARERVEGWDAWGNEVN